MTDKIKIVKIDHEYCDYLRKFDFRVSYNAGIKELRPFVGILFKIAKWSIMHRSLVLKLNISI